MGLLLCLVPWWQLVAAVGEKGGIPTPTVMSVRMLLLKADMERAEVERTLGVEKRFGLFDGTLHSISYSYRIQPGHILDLHYRYDAEHGKDVLVEAVLKRDGKAILQVPASGNEPVSQEEVKREALIKQAIKSLQGKRPIDHTLIKSGDQKCGGRELPRR